MNKILLTAAMVLLSVQAWAANYSNPVDGVFKGVSGNKITIEIPSLVSKSPVTTDQTGDILFNYNSDTAYKNFNQLSDLKDGDMVRVEYGGDINKMQQGLVAIGITKLDSSTPMTTSNAMVPATGADESTGVSTPSQTTVTTITTTNPSSQ